MITMNILLRSISIGLAFAVLVSINGCETLSQGDQGELIGGVLGGVVGAQVGEGSGRTVAIIVGTLAGAVIGKHIGESMDDTDRLNAAHALNDSPTGEAVTWVNPDNGSQYTVTPTRTYERVDRPCREFQLDATVGGKADQPLYGTACLQADGSWLVQQ